jgi:hypothetical protein
MRNGTVRSSHAKPTIERLVHDLAPMIGMGRNQIWATIVALREADPNLWVPRASGRAKPHYPAARHLSNLVIALAAIQADTAPIAADRVMGFRMLRQVDGPRPGLTFGEAIDELVDLAARDIGFRGQIFGHQAPVIQVAPGQLPMAEIAGGPSGGRYDGKHGIADVDVLKVVHLMHFKAIGIRHISLIDGSLVKFLAEQLADFRVAQAALEAKGGISSPKETPPSTRPTDESVEETPHAEDRSPNSSDPTLCPSASAIAQSEGGSPPVNETES